MQHSQEPTSMRTWTLCTRHARLRTCNPPKFRPCIYLHLCCDGLHIGMWELLPSLYLHIEWVLSIEQYLPILRPTKPSYC